MANENSTDMTHRLIRCVTGEETYCLKRTVVAGIERLERLERSYGDNLVVGWMPGVDTRIPVYSLAARLARTQPTMNIDNRIIVVNAESCTYGLLVDKVSDAFEITDKDIHPLPPVLAGAASYFEGIAWAGDRLLLCLAPDQLHREGSATSVSSTTMESFPEASQTVVDAATAAKRKSQLLTFGMAAEIVDEFTLGLSLTQVMEILEPAPLVPVPGAPDYVLGLANWRRNPVPVIDLKSRFGLTLSPEIPQMAKSSCRMLIARAPRSSQLCGFLIQPNPKTHSLPIPHEPCENEFPVPRILVRGVFELENEVLVLPDLDRMIA